MSYADFELKMNGYYNIADEFAETEAVTATPDDMARSLAVAFLMLAYPNHKSIFGSRVARLNVNLQLCRKREGRRPRRCDYHNRLPAKIF